MLDNKELQESVSVKEIKGSTYVVTNFNIYANPIFNIDDMHVISLDSLVDYSSPKLNLNYFRKLDDRD